MRMSLHNIKSISLSKSELLTQSHVRPHVRHLVIKTKEGETADITLFADDKESLKIKKQCWQDAI